MSDPVQIVFQPPDKNKPGFLKRQKKALQFQRMLNQSDPTPEALDLMVEFLSEFVIEPQGKAEAIEAIWEASEAQWQDMMQALRGSGEPAPLPPD